MAAVRVYGPRMINREQYRDAMARLGAAVNVVATDGPGGRRGFTASAVCSVTDSPPTLLVCCNRAHDTHEALTRNGVLSVNTLAGSQTALSDVFAGVGGHADRFIVGEWDVAETGAPMLRGAAVAFDCRIVHVRDVGTHSVFFAEVDAARLGDANEGLMYFARSYHALRPA